MIVLFHPGDPTGKDAVSTTMRAQALAEAGLLVFAPTWNTEFTAPTSEVFFRSMDRASCALAYAEEHAPDHDGDVSAIATFGGSAGAQPAAWLALGHGTPGEGCVADADPIVPDGPVLIDSEYFLHSTVFQPLFDREPEAARGIVAGFVDPTGWSPGDAASSRLAAAETQAMLVRPIDEPGDPASWLAQRDVDGSLVADLENLGALDDGTVDHLDEARLLQHRLEATGVG